MKPLTKQEAEYQRAPAQRKGWHKRHSERLRPERVYCRRVRRYALRDRLRRAGE